MGSNSYNVSVTWMHDREGWADASGVRDVVKFSAPPEFGGRGDLWSPELLLVLAASSCFLSTFLVLAEHKHLRLVAYRAQAEGRVERVSGRGYQFTEIVLQPAVTLENEGDAELAQRLLEKSEHICLVANALKIPVRVEATLETAAPALNG